MGFFKCNKTAARHSLRRGRMSLGPLPLLPFPPLLFSSGAALMRCQRLVWEEFFLISSVFCFSIATNFFSRSLFFVFVFCYFCPFSSYTTCPLLCSPPSPPFVSCLASPPSLPSCHVQSCHIMASPHTRCKGLVSSWMPLVKF